MTLMKHFKLVGAVALGLATGSAALADTVNLRMASYLPPEHFGTKLIINPMIAKIDEMTGGSVKIELFPGGQLANAPGTLNAVKSGIANMGFVGVGYVGDAMPLSTIVEAPGAFVDLEKGTNAYSALVKGTLADEEFLANGVRPLMIALLPQQQLNLAKTIEINTLADLAGLKIRAPSATAGDAISALGMTPVEMPITDLYLALERGTVDGAVALTASVPSYKLNEVTTAITTNLALGSVAFAVVISEKDWQKLTPEQQEQVAHAGEEAEKGAIATLVKVNAGAEKKLTDAGMSMITVSDAVQAEIATALASIEQGWIASVSERNPKAAEVAAGYKAFLAQQ